MALQLLDCTGRYAHLGIMSFDSIQLAGKLLVAMPDMGDPRFERSVIFICAHSRDRAMGLIINKPAQDLKFNDLLKQLDIKAATRTNQIKVHVGGPVDYGRGFVLHSQDYDSSKSTLGIEGGFALTATLDILEDISQGDGPERCLLAMGYAGWGPGQLEAEIQHNGWLICDAQTDLVFSGENDGKWTRALDLMGINPLLLSPGGGSA